MRFNKHLLAAAIAFGAASSPAVADTFQFGSTAVSEFGTGPYGTVN